MDKLIDQKGIILKRTFTYSIFEGMPNGWTQDVYKKLA